MLTLGADTLAACAERLPVPEYDRDRVTTGVVHLGVGGFHRAHQAMFHERLLAAGALEWGICGVGVLPGDRRMQEVMEAQDGLYTLILKHADGRYDARVIGAVRDYLFAPDDPDAVVERLADPQTRVVTLTITEGGYNLDEVTGRFDATDADVVHDLAEPDAARTAFGLVVEALDRRRARDVGPFTILSCDNLVASGERARSAFTGFARLRDPGLARWMDRNVSFPDCMVDRITPATTDADRAELRDRLGIDDGWPVVCEPFEAWVIEDVGEEALPPYAQAGARIVDDVHPYEQMKLRLLNAGHQAIAYVGLLCGHRYVHEAAQDPLIRAFVTGYLVEEATPTLGSVPAQALEAFRAELLPRFANAHVADTLARLTVDASDRMPGFLLPVVREQLARGGDVRRSATVVAAWARFAGGVDEAGAPFEVRDRRRDQVVAAARRAREDPDAFLTDQADVFGSLADDERFRSAYRRALGSLHARGARATLDDLT